MEITEIDEFNEILSIKNNLKKWKLNTVMNDLELETWKEMILKLVTLFR